MIASREDDIERSLRLHLKRDPISRDHWQRRRERVRWASVRRVRHWTVRGLPIDHVYGRYPIEHDEAIPIDDDFGVAGRAYTLDGKRVLGASARERDNLEVRTKPARGNAEGTCAEDRGIGEGELISLQALRGTINDAHEPGHLISDGYCERVGFFRASVR